jgi:hypothetical protein
LKKKDDIDCVDLLYDNKKYKTPYALYINKLTTAAQNIEKAIKKLDFAEREVAVLVRPFPTGSINAQIIAYPEGDLILFNTGLLSFFAGFLAILLKLDILQDEILRKDVVPSARICRSEAVDLLANLLYCYLSMKPVKRNENHFVFGGCLFPLWQTLSAECFYFVLAHEYAHSILDHVNSSKKIVSKHTPKGDMDFVWKSWEEEIMADIFGIRIQLMTVEEVEQTDWLPYVITSVNIFFILII